jgi:hypothetical protein
MEIGVVCTVELRLKAVTTISPPASSVVAGLSIGSDFSCARSGNGTSKPANTGSVKRATDLIFPLFVSHLPAFERCGEGGQYFPSNQ